MFITDRGRPAHVLLSITDYRRLTGEHGKIADLLATSDADFVELESPARRERAHGADLS